MEPEQRLEPWLTTNFTTQTGIYPRSLADMLCWKMSKLRQFAFAEGFFCAMSYRIGKEEILGIW
jgi:hypothetical protein